MNLRDTIMDEMPSFSNSDISYGEVADAIIAAMPECVPDLVWGTTSYGKPECYINNSVYRIVGAMSGGYNLSFGRHVIRAEVARSNFATEQSAKAAANAHNRAAFMAAFGV